MTAIESADPFDRELLDELAAVLGPENAARLLDRFARELPAQADLILRNVGCGDFDQARRGAHSCRGAALTIGATAIAEIAGSIEQAPDADLERLAPQLCRAAAETASHVPLL